MTLFSVFVVVQIILAVCLVVIVLLQQGKGAEAGAALSGGAQSLLGTSSGGSTIARVTAVLATLFFVNSIFLAAITPQNSALDSVIIEQQNNQDSNRQNDGSEVPSIPLPR